MKSIYYLPIESEEDFDDDWGERTMQEAETIINEWIEKQPKEEPIQFFKRKGYLKDLKDLKDLKGRTKFEGVLWLRTHMKQWFGQLVAFIQEE